MRDRRAYLRTVAAIGGATVIAGCGGADDDGDAEATPTGDGGAYGDEPTATTGTGESAQDAYPDYNWGSLDEASPEATTTVTMSGFAFDPLVASVSAGEAVGFPNDDSAVHSVTAPAAGIDREVDGGQETTITIDESGTYDYVCRFHPPAMLGRLVVE